MTSLLMDVYLAGYQEVPGSRWFFHPYSVCMLRFSDDYEMGVVIRKRDNDPLSRDITVSANGPESGIA